MIKRFRNLKWSSLVVHMLITLAYPVAKALLSSRNRLLVFTDALTILALVLLAGGVVVSLFLHGDFDITGFALRRGIRREKDYSAYLADKKEKREAAFNYPLFLGLVYLLLSGILAYGFL